MSSSTPLVDECTHEYMKTYLRSRVTKLNVEEYDYTGAATVPWEVEVYLKSIRELSVDEVPIIRAIVEAFEDRRLLFYEYENIRKKDDRATVASRLIRRGIEEGKSFILVLPSLMPISLANLLPLEVQEAISNSLALRAEIEYSNLLYIPTGRDSIEIVAKQNSKASYERVRWLRCVAEDAGITVTREVYLPDNRAIFEYVTAAGPDGLYQRVPVNKLAGFIIAVSRCLGMPGIRELLRKENVVHYIYAHNLPAEDIERLADSLRRQEGRHPAPSSLLYDAVFRGSRIIIAELLARTGLI